MNSNDQEENDNNNDNQHPLTSSRSIKNRQTENIKKDYTTTSTYVNRTIVDSTAYNSSFDDFFENTNLEDKYSSSSTPLKTTTYSESKSIPVSNIDEAVKLFNLSSQSPSTLYNEFKNSTQSPTSMYQKETSPSIYPRRFDDLKEDNFSPSDANLNSNTRGKNFDPPRSPMLDRYRDSNNFNPSSSFTEYDGLTQFNQFNGYDDFPNMSSLTGANYKNTNKLASTSTTDLPIFNDPLMMDMDIQVAASSATATSHTISSPTSQYKKQLTDPLLLSSSLSSSANTSSALFVDPTLTSNYVSSPSGLLSLSVPLDVDVNLRNSSSSSSRFYSSITLPNITKEDDPLFQNKKSLLDKPLRGQLPLPSSSSLSITIPSSFESEEEKRLKEGREKSLTRSMSLNLGEYDSNYTSLIPSATTNSSTSPTSTTFLTMSKIKRMEEEEKEKEKGEKAQEFYRAMTIDMNLPSTSNQYSSLVASDLSTNVKSVPPASSSIDTSNPSSSTYLLSLKSKGVNGGGDDLSMKDAASSAKNEEMMDLSSSVSSNYLTPPLSPSLPTSTFVEFQEQTFPPPKIYPCGLDTPCIDNCNCSECIATMTLPSLLNRRNAEIVKEENNRNINKDQATASHVSPSRPKNDNDNSIKEIEVPKKEEEQEEPSWNSHEHSCQVCRGGSHHDYDHDHDYDSYHCEDNNAYHSHHYDHDHDYDHNHNHDHSHHDDYHQDDHDHRHYDHPPHDQNHDNSERKEYSQDHQEYELKNDKITTTTSTATKAMTTIDQNMSYGTGDVIIEVGCSNTNCPRTDCPRRTFKPIASVSNGKICRTSDAVELLNDAPLCSNYNPLYHLIAAAEIATKNINDSEKNDGNDSNNNKNNSNNNNSNNNNNNNNSTSCAHCSKAKACQARSSSSSMTGMDRIKDSSSSLPNDSKNNHNAHSSTSPSSASTTSHGNACQHCYSTDIENCHMALSSATLSSPSSVSTSVEEVDQSHGRSVPYKNFKSIKASVTSVKGNHHSHHHSLSSISNPQSHLHQVSTITGSSESYSNPSTSSISPKSDHVAIAPITTTATTASPEIAMSRIEKTSSTKEEDITEKSGSRSSHHFQSIYIRQDYSPLFEAAKTALTSTPDPIATNATSDTATDEASSIYYESINYTKLLANQMKMDAESPNTRKKTIQNYETLKNGLASSTGTATPTTSSSTTSIFRTITSALNPLASSTTSTSSTNLRTSSIFRPKLSWIPAPIHSQLEPTINPLLLKTNLYANVNLSAATTTGAKTNKKRLSSGGGDSVIDTCQVTTTNILDKKQAIEQAIRCSHCPHSDRCYKRIRIEQLIN